MACIALAYVTYGKFLARFFQLDARKPTPAVEMQDGVDYIPIEPRFLLGQHFSAIAAAGPIVGPILAGLTFGWLPALLWILGGCIFIGGAHDLGTLVASIRHKACSITQVVRQHVSRRAFLLFLVFIWIALVYIIVVFTDITASSFVGLVELEDGTRIPGGAIATSSLLYLALPVAMGVLMHRGKLSLGWATAIFLPLVGVAIWAGPRIPFNLDKVLGIEVASGRKIWDVALLLYCLVASLVPMWLLLQPRGHLGGYFLFLALGAGAVGLLFAGKTVAFPAFKGWDSTKGPLFPTLFILVACGACSGFHAIISSGTTSKQLKRETDARPIGYGAMLLEGLVAVMSLCFVMMLAADDPLTKKAPNFIYAGGIGKFLGTMGIPAAVGVNFGLLAFTTFVYDTLDICTRLGRYIIEELTRWRGRWGRWFATGVCTAVPLAFVMNTTRDAQGNEIPAWKTFWDLFGASNQLLAALALLAVTVWLARTRKTKQVWFVLGLPTLFMYVMSTWALLRWVKAGFFGTGGFQVPSDPVPWVALVLVALAGVMLVEAYRVLPRTPGPSKPYEAFVTPVLPSEAAEG